MERLLPIDNKYFVENRTPQNKDICSYADGEFKHHLELIKWNEWVNGSWNSLSVLLGHKLSHKQEDVPIDGWSLECRVYAEVRRYLF